MAENRPRIAYTLNRTLTVLSICAIDTNENSVVSPLPHYDVQCHLSLHRLISIHSDYPIVSTESK